MPTTSWEGRLRDFVWDLPCDQPRFRHGEWRKVFEDQLKSTPLSITVSADPLFALPLGEDQIKWTVWLSKGNIWKRFRTLGQIAVLEGEALEVSPSFSNRHYPRSCQGGRGLLRLPRSCLRLISQVWGTLALLHGILVVVLLASTPC